MKDVNYTSTDLSADIGAALFLTIQMAFSYENGFDFSKDTKTILGTFAARFAVIFVTVASKKILASRGNKKDEG